MKTAAPIVLALLFVSGCAHQRAPQISVHAPTRIAATHALAAWTGEVRVAVGSSADELDRGASAALVEATVHGLIRELGIPAKVEVLSRDGDLGVFGAVHARVRVAFPGRVSLEKKYEALDLLESLRPGAGAYVPRPSRGGGAGGISASVSH